MLSWMLEVPPYALDRPSEAACKRALSSGDATKLPTSLPRWVFLEWLTGQGYVLHGSNLDDLSSFEPRIPNDRSPDDFSKRTAVFASSDGLWAMMYALTERVKVKRMLNMALQIREGGEWARMRYFLSLSSLNSISKSD